MDFFKQAASFVGSKKAEESSNTSGEGFDVNNVSDLMSKAEGFLAEKKPETFAPKPVEEEEPVKEEEVVKKPSEVTEDVPESATTEEDTERQSSADPVKPTVPEDSPVNKTTTATSSEVPPESSKSDAKPSYSELYKSAQTLYSGLQGKLEGKTDVDNQQIAGAAEHLVQGAESFGLLKADNPYSSYFKKAEGYLHDYSSSDSAPKKPSSDENA